MKPKLLVLMFLVLLLSCAKSSGSSRKSKPPPEPFGTATISGIDVYFATTAHIYDPTFNLTVIGLTNSIPLGVELYMGWPGDVNPGFTDTNVGFEMIFIDTGANWWLANSARPASWATSNVTKFGPTPGKRTKGTFQGLLESEFGPFQYITIQGGEYIAVRQ